ncbi:glycosyltransferase family 2 protein [Bosea sp. 2KB_26]|uniref:glycosyltransferase family 2 protein n=1 Tax=Bosea sp. 2KB_26 TaxID=3237475 RepID=UPI003F9308E7
MSNPWVSVVMSVYNGAADAPKAIRSILDQTFGDFELIAIDNGSFKDDTRAVLESIAQKEQDARLRIVTLDQNIGLAGALNHGIALARGRYIARQDHDDLSLPDRLARQVAYMDSHPGCGLLGTRAEIWIGDQPTGRAHDHPLDNATLQLALLFNNPFVHSSVMIRRSALDLVGDYTTDLARQPPEDYELWSRIARRFEVANLPERLLVYREMPNSMSRNGPNPFLDRLLLLASENIAFWNGLAVPDTACHDAAALSVTAYDRLSPGADIQTICARVEQAIDAIDASALPPTAVADRAQALANLRHHYGLARKLPNWSRPFIKLGRKIPLSTSLRKYVKNWLTR